MQGSIFQKCLLVVAGPMLLWIGFVIGLACLLHQADQEMEKEAHSKEVLACVEKMGQSCIQCTASAMTYAATRQPVFLLRFEEQDIIRREEIERAIALTKDDPKQAALMQEVRKTAPQAYTLVRAGLESGHPLKSIFGLQASNLERKGHPIFKMKETIEELIKNEERTRKDSKESREHVRHTIQVVLLGGVLLNVSLTLWLIRLFSRDITDRLKLHLDNTIRLLKRESLNPVVEGGDEIADLDKVLHRTASELIELEKFKKELTAVVSHELRTPLTSIHGVILLLQCGALGKQNEAAQSKISIAERNTRRLIKLINDLLDIEKMEADSMQMSMVSCQLDPIIDQAIDAVAEFAASHQVTVQTSKSGLWVNADSDRLVQVLINLLSNAVKYSPQGGTVTLQTSPAENFATVQVIDNGHGIPEEFRSKIFDKFQQVQESDAKEKKGTGLGLAICKAIVEQHGGEVGVDSAIGTGSTFWFRIPLAQALDKATDDDTNVVHP